MTGPGVALRPFAERLELARRLLARGRTSPAHIADQRVAAALETAGHAQTAHCFLQLLEPDRGWRHARLDPSHEQRLYLAAALLGCQTCSHLRRGGPQPAIARLALRRVDCRPCAQTFRRPPAGDGDRCDLCGRREVASFTPFVAAFGATLVSGEVCVACAQVLVLAEGAA